MKSLAVLALVSGCFIVPKSTVTETVVSSHLYEPVASEALPVALHVDLNGSTVVVTASQPRVCTRKRTDTVDVHRALDADFAAIDGNVGSVGNPAGLLVLGGLAAVTGVVSGLVTGVVLIADNGGTTERVVRDVELAAYRCPIPAAEVPIEIRFGSGVMLNGTTDRGGVFVAQRPRGDAGEIRARAFGTDGTLLETVAR